MRKYRHVTGPDAQLSLKGSALLKEGFPFLNQMDGRFYVGEKHLSFSCEQYLLGTSDKECMSQFSLQSFDGLTDCGLGNI